MKHPEIEKIIKLTVAGIEAQADRTADTLESIEAIYSHDAALAAYAMYEYDSQTIRMLGMLSELGLPKSIVEKLADQVSENSFALTMVIFHSVLGLRIPSEENDVEPSPKVNDLAKTYVSMIENFQFQHNRTMAEVEKTIKKG